MITRRPPPGDIKLYDDDEEPPRIPFWKRKGVLVTLAGLAGFIALIVMSQTVLRGPTEQKAQPGESISVRAQYDPPPAPPPPPAPKRLPDLDDPPPLPPRLFKETRAPAAPPKEASPVNGKPVAARPAMMTFDVPAPKTPQNGDKQPEGQAPQHTSIKFDATSIPGMKASPAQDMSLVMTPGLLPCVLEYAIDSNLPGSFLCHLPFRVDSERGVTLMEAGSRVRGKYESLTQNGVKRLKAEAVFGWTPNGVWVPLTGQSFADGLGRAGMSGEYDPRYLERFAGAILLDIAKAGLSILQTEVAKGGSTYVNLNQSDSLASEILRSTINLPPIMTKNQGEWIAISLDSPISFAESYRLK